MVHFGLIWPISPSVLVCRSGHAGGVTDTRSGGGIRGQSRFGPFGFLFGLSVCSFACAEADMRVECQTAAAVAAYAAKLSLMLEPDAGGAPQPTPFGRLAPPLGLARVKVRLLSPFRRRQAFAAVV